MKSLIVITLAAFLSTPTMAAERGKLLLPVKKEEIKQKIIEKLKPKLEELKPKLEALKPKLDKIREEIKKHDEKIQAVIACFQDSGLVQPARGEKLSEEDKAIIDQCLKDSGIEIPQRPIKKE